MVQILIPTSKQIQSKTGKQQYTVYCIEIYSCGKRHRVDKRYSEFYELHRKLKKYFNQLPNLPPKKVLRNSSQKLIEQRRISLEDYLKSLLKNIGLDKAKELNEFLNLNTPLNESSIHLKKLDGQHKFLFRSISPNDEEDDSYRNFNFHQCMIGFKNDYLFSIDNDLSSYLNSSPGSLYSDSSSTKSNMNCETNSCTSTSTSSSSSSSSLESGYCDIVVMGSLNALYDKSLKKF